MRPLKSQPRRRSLEARLAGAMPARLLAVAVLLGSGGAGVAYSHDPSRVLDAMTHAGAFQVRAMQFDGNEETSTSAIIAAIDLPPQASLLGVDARAARARVQALPWVERATVRKVLPGTLRVEVEERAPYARWSHAGREMLVGATGEVLADSVPSRYARLPLVAGAGANMVAGEAQALLAAFPAIARRTLAAIRINERRWDLRLKSGATVRLPERGAGEALARLLDMETRGALLHGPVAVDMRLADRTTVRLASAAEVDAAAAATIPSRPAVADPLAAAIAEATMDDPLAALLERSR